MKWLPQRRVARRRNCTFIVFSSTLDRTDTKEKTIFLDFLRCERPLVAAALSVSPSVKPSILLFAHGSVLPFAWRVLGKPLLYLSDKIPQIGSPSDSLKTLTYQAFCSLILLNRDARWIEIARTFQIVNYSARTFHIVK